MTSLRRILASAAITIMPAIAAAQAPVTITGHVTAERGATLGNVTVSLAELGLGAITRDDSAAAISCRTSISSRILCSSARW